LPLLHEALLRAAQLRAQFDSLSAAALVQALHGLAREKRNHGETMAILSIGHGNMVKNGDLLLFNGTL